MAISLLFSILCFFNFLNADLTQMTIELQQKNMESQKKIDPLIQEAANLERQKAEVELKKKQIESQELEIKAKTEKIQKETFTTASAEELSEILNGKIGNCILSQGTVPNEFYIKYDDKFEKFSIRMIFANVESSQRPIAQIYRQDGVEYFEIIQKEFLPSQAANKTNFHSATIRFDQQKKVVHAVFKGEMISDKGPFGLFGSSFISRGITCKTIEAAGSI
ncbi:hypothetical protein K2X05_11995 [bacterium]|nr:hypothetical protein [bacterium]